MSTGNLAVYAPRASTQVAAAGPADVISTFVQGAVLAKTVWAVSGSHGLAHVDSPTGSGRQALLVWSAHHEASKWADVLSQEPELVTIDIPSFIADTLARASLANTIIAPDWASEPIEPEVEPSHLLALLQQALVQDFVTIALKTRSVFVLQSLERVMPITVVDGRSEVVPVWSDRAMAEAAAQQVDGIVMPVRMPLAEFTGRFLLSAQGVRARIAPGYVHSAGAVSYSTWEFKALLNRGGTPSAVRVA
jgi:Protein of unknown function (DUF2750)